MKNRVKGGLETIIATIVIVGLVAALLFAVVAPMAEQGEGLIHDTTNTLADHQTTIGPGV